MITPRENLLRTLRRQGFEKVSLDCGDFCGSQVEPEVPWENLLAMKEACDNYQG